MDCFDAISGMSRVLKQLFSHTAAETGSMLGVLNQLAVTQLLDNGQSLDVIVGCLKVHLAEFEDFVFVCKYKKDVVLNDGEFSFVIRDQLSV